MMRKKAKSHDFKEDMKRDYDFIIYLPTKFSFAPSVKSMLKQQRKLLLSDDFDTSANAGVQITNFFLTLIENMKKDHPKVEKYIFGLCVDDNTVGKHEVRVLITKTKRKVKNTPVTIIAKPMTLNGEEHDALFF